VVISYVNFYDNQIMGMVRCLKHHQAGRLILDGQVGGDLFKFQTC